MKNGFKVLDSDLHTMEPDGLWARYLEEPFRKFAPTFVRRTENASNQPLIRIGALEIAEMSTRPQTAVVGKDLQRRAFARHPHYEVAHARGYDSESHVAAMDIEGIDVAVSTARAGARCSCVSTGRERQDQGQDPLGQLRAPLQAERCPVSQGRVTIAYDVSWSSRST